MAQSKRKISKALIATVALSLLASTASADYYNSVDDDGCWDGETSNGSDCIVEADSYWTDNRLTVVLKNRCSHRIYVRACNGRESGSDDCGAFSIAGGSKRKHYTYNADGTYGWQWVGSVNSSQDWVCSGKVNGWGD